MSSIVNSLYSMRHMDDLARRESIIHNIHPLVKLITTVIFIAVVMSFGRYEIGRLLPFFLYPVTIITVSDLPKAPIFKRILIVEPFIIGIGILNPLFDSQTFVIGEIVLSKGWITFGSIFIKSLLTVTAALLLIATTGMDKLAGALRMLKVPRLFVLQLLLTYRYISVLSEEVGRMLRAYSLRAPEQKGIHRNAWASFSGQLLIRTFDRAQRVYHAMCTRGFTGEYNTGSVSKIKLRDYIYWACWVIFFAAVRMFDLPVLIGSMITGVIY
ncbi:cobalt ECF transporter T component CbiQ [Pseudobacteroides cellulosolvens]|uniref:Cobalt ABC transporter, inner membrane subunit CbiQ n=1 Tax=Pseudobacteroides cellulosolvens ATCC 35603 = DSM 2933 TaxID=398512 RepID=A0A0L6JU13_9FIRM|nr:cobalt ECF transporter T component CbiQ [Pseudobacteroides cellulosolvens]KNY29303.1 cobalt ABC transporter, inner membrane subunit CbiQ [Pseudobacteroides cellulosolvens ATCC 35603 = DSM 2933]